MSGPALSVSICLLLVLTACSGQQSATPQNERLIITGSSTLAPLVTEIAQRYESRFPHTRVDVQSGGSARGMSDVRNGLASIGMVSRRIRPDEQDLNPTLLARDGVALIVHQHNPVNNLTVEQVRAIYTGRISNWRELGGADQTISVIHKAEGRSTLEVFLQFFGLSNRDIQPDTVIGENEQAIKLVSQNPAALAYVSIGSARFHMQHGEALKLLALNNIEPDLTAVQTGRFPLVRELNLVTAIPNNPQVQHFLAFSQQQHELIREQQLVPVTP